MHTFRDALRRQLIGHLRQRAGLYLLNGLVFAVGIALGALSVGVLDDTQRLELVHYVDFYLGGVADPVSAPAAHDVFRQALASNLRTGAFLYVLGLSVVGAPLCLGVLLVRGFVAGFAVAFLVAHKGWLGLGVAALAVIPQHLVAVPALVAMAVGSLAFAGRVARRQPPARAAWAGLLALTATTSGGLLALVAASLVEGYLSPAALRLLVRLAG